MFTYRGRDVEDEMLMGILCLVGSDVSVFEKWISDGVYLRRAFFEVRGREGGVGRI